MTDLITILHIYINNNINTKFFSTFIFCSLEKYLREQDLYRSEKIPFRNVRNYSILLIIEMLQELDRQLSGK